MRDPNVIFHATTSVTRKDLIRATHTHLRGLALLRRGAKPSVPMPGVRGVSLSKAALGWQTGDSHGGCLVLGRMEDKAELVALNSAPSQAPLPTSCFSGDGVQIT